MAERGTRFRKAVLSDFPPNDRHDGRAWGNRGTVQYVLRVLHVNCMVACTLMNAYFSPES